MELCKEFRFEASHILPKHPGKCSRLHGHSWVLRVFVAGPVDVTTGFVQDYADISAKVKPLVEALDHRHLGTWYDIQSTYNSAMGNWGVLCLPEHFYPTSENLIVWIGEQLSLGAELPWSKLELEETCTSRCTLIREEFDVLQR